MGEGRGKMEALSEERGGERVGEREDGSAERKAEGRRERGDIPGQ
jgi:hypothetical protein